jgi:surfactin synthase thioesterase subunit
LVQPITPCPLLQGKPYALFGTCLGAIVAYEVARRVADRRHAPMPLALFPAAVSPPHLYALAVMKLYVQRAVGERWHDQVLWHQSRSDHLWI